jgi:hypothetical protein
MISRATIFSSFFYLAIIAATRFAFASPAIKPAIEQTLQEASLEDRWSAIHQHVGNSGMDVLCQAVLPLATATRTGTSILACDLRRLTDDRCRPFSADVIFATPSTTTTTDYTTAIADETVYDTSGIFVSLSLNFSGYEC